MRKLMLCAILALIAVCVAGCAGDWWESNRCVLLDRNHTFTHATVIYGNTNVTYEVVAWKDYENSDSVQLWVKDAASPRGHKVVLTHYARVVMENRTPKYDPKF